MERQDNEPQEEHRGQAHPPPNPSEESDFDAIAEIIGGENFEQVPPGSRGRISRSVNIFTSIGGDRFNPLLHRIKPEHISASIANRERSSEREHQTQSSVRRYQFLYFLIGLIAAIGLIVFFSLTDDRVTLTTVIVAVLGFAAGFGVGRANRRG